MSERIVYFETPSETLKIVVPEKFADLSDDQVRERMAARLGVPANTPPVRAEPPNLAGWEQPEPGIIAGFERGMLDPLQGAKQGILFASDAATGGDSASQYTADVNEELALYERGRANFDPTSDEGGSIDWPRLAGNVVASAPAALARTVGGAIASGGALSSLLFTPSDPNENPGQFAMERAQNTALGGGGAAAGQTVANILAAGGPPLARLGRAITGRRGPGVPMYQTDVTLPPTGLTPAQQARAEMFERQGVRPTRAMVTKDPSDWTAEQNARKLLEDRGYVGGEGNPLADAWIDAEQQAVSQVQNLPKTIGTQGIDAGDATINAVQGVGKQSQRRVSELYDAAKDTPGIGELTPDTAALRSTLTDVYDEFTDYLGPAVRKDIEQIVDGDLAPTVQNIQGAMKRANAQARSSDDATSAAGKAAGRVYREALESMAAGGNNQAAAALRKATSEAARRFGMIDGPKGRPTRTVQQIIDGKLSPEQLEAKFMKASAEDLENVRRFLVDYADEMGYHTRQQGREAWEGIRNHVVTRLERAALRGYDEAGNATISHDRLKQAWDGLDRRQDVLFTPEEKDLIDDVVELTVALGKQPPSAAPQYSNNLPHLRNIMQQLAFRASALPSLRTFTSLMMGGMDAGEGFMRTRQARMLGQEAIDARRALSADAARNVRSSVRSAVGPIARPVGVGLPQLRFDERRNPADTRR